MLLGTSPLDQPESWISQRAGSSDQVKNDSAANGCVQGLAPLGYPGWFMSEKVDFHHSYSIPGWPMGERKPPQWFGMWPIP